MKRYTALLCLLLCAAFPLGALAAETGAPGLTLSCERDGDGLTVTVGIVNNPGIAGFDVALSFDSAALGNARFTVNGAWPADMTVTDCVQDETGGTVKVACVRENDFTDDAALFSVTFEAPELLLVNLSAQGTACSWDEREVALAPASAASAADVLRVSADTGALQSTPSAVTGAVTLTVESYGNGHSGEAKAILACYQGGRFVGCAMCGVTIAHNAATDVTFTDISFPLSGEGEPTLKLLLIGGADFVPLCAAA